MNDVLAIVLCGVYVSAEAALAYYFYQYRNWKSETVRKFVHIMTANLVLPVTYVITSFWGRLFGPILFILINAAASYSGFGKHLGMTDRKRHSGLVFYPLSVLFLTFLNLAGILSAPAVVAGVFIMGWGDGFAALVGTKFGKHKYNVFGKYHKSVEGTMTMAAMSFLAVLVFAPTVPLWGALAVAVVAALLENISPSGIDNLSVPILSSFLLEALCTL